jgi:hypothetical protein
VCVCVFTPERLEREMRGCMCMCVVRALVNAYVANQATGTITTTNKEPKQTDPKTNKTNATSLHPKKKHIKRIESARNYFIHGVRRDDGVGVVVGGGVDAVDDGFEAFLEAEGHGIVDWRGE